MFSRRTLLLDSKGMRCYTSQIKVRSVLQKGVSMQRPRQVILTALLAFAISIALSASHVGHLVEVQAAPGPAQGTSGTQVNCASIECSSTLLDGLQRSV